MKPLFLLLFFSAALSAQTRYYVNPVAFGQNNGLTWYDAFTDLHSAMAAAEAGDEIWIAEGTYYPSSTGDRDAHFHLLSGVQVYGGFAGTEMDLSQRDWEAHPTVLDGDIGVAGDSTDNSYNLLYLKDPVAGSRLDGLVFRHAFANKPGTSNGQPGSSGAGLYVSAESGQAYLDVQGCVFERNTAMMDGGGAYVDGLFASFAPQFMGCTFLSNRSVNRSGGGVAKNGSSFIELPKDFYRCQFVENTARRGSAIQIYEDSKYDTINITTTVFTRNQSSQGASTTGAGGVLNVSYPRINSPTVVQIKGTYITKSQMTLNGSVLGSINSLFDSGNIHWYIDSTIFDQNTTILSGFEVGANSLLKFNHVIFKNEKFSSFYMYSLLNQNHTANFQNISLENSSLYVNAYQAFGKIKIQNLQSFNSQSDRGRLILSSTSTLHVDNMLFVNSDFNDSVDRIQLSAGKTSKINGSVLVNSSLKTSAADTISISNCIFSLKSRTTYTPPPPYALLSNNLFEGGEFPNLLDWTQQNNLWNTDPLFVQPDSGDFRLQACSPAINVGNNLYAASATDLAGQARIQFGTVDIGPYESGPIAFESSAQVQPACPQAANGSAEVLGQDICLPATYTWSHDPLLQGPLAQSLAPGTYTVTVTDSRGRSGTAVLEIPLAQPPLLHLNTVPVLCGDTLGGSVVAEADGLPPFQYQWAGFPDTDSVLQGLPIGQYPLTVTDGRGCTAAALAQVDKTDGLDMGVQVTPVSCFGASDGGYLIVPLNGKAPFQWQWTNGPAAPAYSGLSAGPYSGSVTDALGCTLQWQFTLQQPDPISVSASATPASGPQNNDGAVSLDTVLGGTQPYTIQWSNGQSGPDLLGVAPGTYTVSITDERGCLYSAQYVVDFSIGTQEATAQWQVQAFPNPAGEFLFFRTDAPGQVRVRLYDALGRAAVESVAFSGQTALSVAHLPAGAYVWVLEGAGMRVQGRCLAGGF